MKLWPFRREARALPSVENPTVPVSAKNFLEFFGIGGSMPHVTVESALTVPAVGAAVLFLSRTLANLPLHVYKALPNAGAERVTGSLQRVLNEAPNEDWTSFGLRRYMWQQVFTHGRGLAWIERSASGVRAIWPIDVSCAMVQRVNGRKVYLYEGKTYESADVIDIPFMLKDDQLQSRSPIAMGGKAISLALAMGDYAGNFFAGGGIPPLSLTGPLPAGDAAFKRAVGQIKQAMALAQKEQSGYFAVPPGYDLKAVGFDPAKGQMVEARLFQIQEIARVYQLPPIFLMDLSHGTFTNTEQQDLQLTKHAVSQWAKALEEEMNLKLFGAASNRRYVEHNTDALLRGDFKTRVDALGKAINSGQMMPDEARALENRPPAPGGDRLYIQGATVPLERQSQLPAPPAKPRAPA